MAVSPTTQNPTADAKERPSAALALEPFWLLLLTPLLLLPGRFLPIQWQPWIVAAAFLFWPVRWWLQGRVLPPTPVRFAALLFLLWVPLSIYVTTHPARTWEAISYLVLGVVAANALANLPFLQRSPLWIAWGLLLMGVGLSLIGPLVLTHSSLAEPVIDAIHMVAGPLASALGETINPNILANALVAILPIALALVLRGGWSNRSLWRWLAGAAGLLMLVVIVLTESRGALLAVAVMVLLLLALRFPKLLWLLPFLLLGGAALLMMGGVGALDLLTEASNGSATSGIAERVELWQRGLYAIQDFPLTGIGHGTFNTVVPFLYPYFLIAPNADLPDAHNLPIQVGVDMGVPGLILWLAMLVCLFVMMGSVLRNRQNALLWALAAGVLVSYVGMLVTGIFGATNWGVKPAFLPWVIGALAVLVHWQHIAAQRAVPPQQ